MPQNKHECQLTREEKIELAKAEMEMMRKLISGLEDQFVEYFQRYARAEKILREEGAR